MTLDALREGASGHALQVVGTCQALPEDRVGTGTIVLLGPDEPQFWSTFNASPEYKDGLPNAMDRWSARVIGQLSEHLGGRALFPFGQPARPFLTWALRSGECWASPVGLLVHHRSGLLVSFRGAILLADEGHPHADIVRPCESCTDKPCLTACPVGALNGDGYTLTDCHGFLDTSNGKPCLTNGCVVRMACPLSQSVGRAPGQSAFHMASFHPPKT